MELKFVNLAGVNLAGVNLAGVNLAGVNLAAVDGTRVTLGRIRAVAFVSLLALVAGTLAGCASTEFNPTATAPQYPPYDGRVRVLYKLPPTGQYELLGVVVVEGVDVTSESRMMKDLKKKAATHGANVIVMQSGKVKNTAGSLQAGNKTKLAAYAIRMP